MMRGSLLLVLAVLSPLAACSREEQSQPEIMRPVLSVIVAPSADRALGFVGAIEPEFSANLAFRLLGRVVARDVDVGDPVKKGATLAELDPTALDLGVQAARAEIANAEAQLANASATEERQRRLLESRSTSEAVYDSARQARQTAQANLEKAQAAFAKAQEQLDYVRLFSDFDGVVTAVGAEVGQTVAPGQTVVTVARADVREAVVDVPDQLVAGLGADARFDVTLQSLPSIRAEAKLREVAPQADAATRTRRLRLTLIDPPDAFRLGSTVTATRIAAVQPAIDLPLAALLETDGKTRVWVVDPQTSTVAMRDIEVSARNAGSFTVAGGLEEGARVVVAGVHSLSEGQKVRIEGAAP